MWFLLLQIFTLMLLAAACGAALMYWWLGRGRADKAAAEDLLAAQAGRIDKLARQEDMQRELSRLADLIAAHSLKETDQAWIDDRLSRLETRLSSLGVDLGPVMSALSGIDLAVAGNKPPDLRPVDERLSRIEGALRDFKMPEVDLGPVHSGIATLGLRLSMLEPVSSRIAALESKLAESWARLEAARRSETDAIESRLAAILASLTGLNAPDMAPVQSRLTQILAALTALAPPNLAPLQASLRDLETFVMALDRPPPDLSPILGRIMAIEAAIQPVDRRLAGLEEALGSMPGPDLEPVMNAVKAVDSRHDLVAVENRLTAIEYGLAAMHHMLRSRAEAADVRIAPGLHVVRDAGPAAASSRPGRDSDPINVARRADDRANLLSEPAFGAPDDLEMIDGVGPILASLLREIGVFYFWQVAEWTAEEIDWVESKLKHFRGRIRRDDWIGHARRLAAGPGAARRPLQTGGRGKL